MDSLKVNLFSHIMCLAVKDIRYYQFYLDSCIYENNNDNAKNNSFCKVAEMNYIIILNNTFGWLGIRSAFG